MKVIYIASPYRLPHGMMPKQIAVQMDAAHRIMDMGHSPVVPLLTHFLDIHRWRPEEEWLATELALIPRMDGVLRLPGFSVGADGEVAKAKEHGIPVFFGWKDLEDWLASFDNEVNDERV